MKLVVQRVSRAAVEVDGSVVGSIGTGLLVLFGAEQGDTSELAAEAARKVASLRVFEDEEGKMNRDLAAVAGGVLAVSQFTLAADLSRGRRPGFEKALAPDAARALYEQFVRELAGLGVPVATGVFGAMMRVSLVNEGPATFLLELPARKP
jgi:D-tyrosyl-tRNA(Tyr) deacylase